MKKILLIISSVFALTTIATYAQPGSIDLSFNSTDIGNFNGYGISGVLTTSIQSDGKLIVGGNFSSYNGTNAKSIIRLDTDGKLDTTFIPGNGPIGNVFTTCIQNDGKIILGGDFLSFNGTNINRIVRLNINGSLDTTFNIGSGANGTIKTMFIQNDGKIIIGGQFTSYNGIIRNRIARLNTDGTLDIAFNPGTGADNDLVSISIQSDGKLIIGGSFTSYNSIARSRIARLNTNGTLDNTFNPGTGAVNNTSSSNILSTSIQSNGKIIVGGYFTSFNNIAINNVARLNIDGTLDTSFNVGAVANSVVNNVSIQIDGKIIVAGNFISFSGTMMKYIARVNENGIIDTGFNPGTGPNDFISNVLIQNDGKIIIGGNLTSYNGTKNRGLIRLNTNGSIDLTFNQVSGADDQVSCSSIQNDGKIIIGGSFTVYNGNFRNSIARLYNDGTLDTTFNPGSGLNGIVRTMIIQNNGKIIIGGGFTSCNGITRNRIARLNADGTLDSTFDPSIGANNDIIDIAIQNDGKILICGVFSSFNDVSRNRFARLNSDGSLDLSFNPGSGLDNSVSTVLLQNDGKIIIGGFFNSYNGITIRKIARLNTDASLDTTFNPGTSANQNIDNSLIQSDGKIIISGSFTSYNGTPRNRIARLNTDGSIDFSFSPSSGANGIIFSTSIQSDGKIIISGLFSSYDEFSASGIARLNTDGTLDSTFNTGTGASTDIFTTAIQNDGKIIIGGTFVSFNGTGRNRIARIQGGVSLSNSNFEKSTVVIYPNPSNGVFNIHTNTISGTKNIIVYSVIGQQVLNQELNSMETSFDISNQPKGIYFYKIFGMNNVIKRGKLVIE